MRLITWNCKGAYRRKHGWISVLHLGVVVALLLFTPRNAYADATPEEIATKTVITDYPKNLVRICDAVAFLQQCSFSSPPFHQGLRIAYIGRAQSQSRITPPTDGTSYIAFLRHAAQQTDCVLNITKDVILVYPKSELHFFKSTDGRSFSQVIGVRPNGVICFRDPLEWGTYDGYWHTLSVPTKEIDPTDGEVVPFSKLADEFRKRYGEDDAAVSKYVGAGIDGRYTYHEGIAKFTGIEIELHQGDYTFGGWTDTPSASDRPPTEGRYRIQGHWLIFDNAKLAYPKWVMVLLEGRLALMTPQSYVLWKDWGIINQDEVLFRQRTRGKDVPPLR